MKRVNLFGIALDYQPPWELHFGKAPTDRVGGFELLLKEDYKIVNAICVIWRPCDTEIINSLLDVRHHRPSLMKRLFTTGPNTEKTAPKEPAAADFSDQDLVARYCDGVYKSIAKEQGPVTLIKREKRRVNTHAAEFSEFIFPVSKRKKTQGNIHRMQLVLKCNESKRFVALYTSTREKAQQYTQIEKIFGSLKCHENSFVSR